MDLDWSTRNTTSGMSGTSLLGCGGLVLSLSAVTSGRRSAGTPTKPVQGDSRASRAVGERLAGGEDPHTLWTLL
jgi:hypothetical protein